MDVYIGSGIIYEVHLAEQIIFLKGWKYKVFSWLLFGGTNP